MKRSVQASLVGALVAISTVAWAGGESEFQGKIQEDLNDYKARIVGNCGAPAALTLTWNGKLGFNPREIAPGNNASITALATAATDAVSDECQNNKALKKAFSKVTQIVVTQGKGLLSYKLAGTTLTFTVDPTSSTSSATNPASQEDALKAKLEKDLDK